MIAENFWRLAFLAGFICIFLYICVCAYIKPQAIVRVILS